MTTAQNGAACASARYGQANLRVRSESIRQIIAIVQESN